VCARPVHRDFWLSQLRDKVRLLMEWPKEGPEPTNYWLSNLPTTTAIEALVATTKARCRIERDYEELKRLFELRHYEGRGWRGFHHHATLCIAAYGILLAQRLRKKGLATPATFLIRKLPRAGRVRAQRHINHSLRIGRFFALQ